MRDGTDGFDHAFANQLKWELNQCWEGLPPQFKFERFFPIPMDNDFKPPEMDPYISMLRADYVGHCLVIDWPLLDLIITGRLRNIGLEEEVIVRKWFENTFRFISVLSKLVDFYHPNLWTMTNSYIHFALQSNVDYFSAHYALLWGWNVRLL